VLGRLIGSAGATYRELCARTSAHIFVLDKEGAPPGWADDSRLVSLRGSRGERGTPEITPRSPASRLVSLMGTEAQVRHARAEVQVLLGDGWKHFFADGKGGDGKGGGGGASPRSAPPAGGFSFVEDAAALKGGEASSEPSANLLGPFL